MAVQVYRVYWIGTNHFEFNKLGKEKVIILSLLTVLSHSILSLHALYNVHRNSTHVTVTDCLFVKQSKHIKYLKLTNKQTKELHQNYLRYPESIAQSETFDRMTRTIPFGQSRACGYTLISKISEKSKNII